MANFNFRHAMRLCQRGTRVKRREWVGQYVTPNETQPQLITGKSNMLELSEPYRPTFEDLNADDWTTHHDPTIPKRAPARDSIGVKVCAAIGWPQADLEHAEEAYHMYAIDSDDDGRSRYIKVDFEEGIAEMCYAESDQLIASYNINVTVTKL